MLPAHRIQSLARSFQNRSADQSNRLRHFPPFSTSRVRNAFEKQSVKEMKILLSSVVTKLQKREMLLRVAKK